MLEEKRTSLLLSLLTLVNSSMVCLFVCRLITVYEVNCFDLVIDFCLFFPLLVVRTEMLLHIGLAVPFFQHSSPGE